MTLRHLGYPCICLSLGSLGATSSTMTATRALEFSPEERKQRISQIIERNLAGLRQTLEWNAENKIHLFRITSNLFPLGTHPSLGYDIGDLPNIPETLKSLGDIANSSEQRLSSHPGQYVCLGSPEPQVVEASIRELNHHALWMSFMGLDGLPNMNIHMGGTYGDKKECARRFISNFQRLSQAARSYLSLENDDRRNGWSVRETVDLVSSETGIPVVFDLHHHRFCSGGDSELGAFCLASSTWRGWGSGVPELHYSESRTAHNSRLDYFGQRCRPTAHSDWIDGPIREFPGVYDLTIEAKQKDLALLRYQNRVAVMTEAETTAHLSRWTDNPFSSETL